MINITDVRARINALTEKSSPITIDISNQYNRIIESNDNIRLEDINNCVRNWQNLNVDRNNAINMLLELFFHICDSNCISEQSLDRICKSICEDAIPKVRDAAQTQYLIKRRLGRTKSKIQTKINSNLNDMKDAASDAIENIKANTAKNIDQIKQNADALAKKDKENHSTEEEEKKDDKITEYYNMLIEACASIITCDNIISNHAKLSKRYNIDSYFKEHSMYQSDYDTICEFYKLVDTYNLPLEAKAIISVQNGIYGFEKNHITYNEANVIKAVIDSIMMNTNEQNFTESVDAVLLCIHNNKIVSVNENNIISNLLDYSKASLSNVNIDSAIDNNKIKISEDGYSFAEVYVATHDTSYFSEGEKINQALAAIDKFKIDTKEKTIESLKSLVRTIYAKDEEDIILAQPNLFNIIRIFFVVGGSFAINPLLGVVSAITDYSIAMKIKRKDADRLVTNYKNEIKKTEKKLEHLKSEDSINRTQKYLDKLNDGLDKIKQYRDDLYGSNDDSKPADDDFDFNFDESTLYKMADAIPQILHCMENELNLTEDKQNTEIGDIALFIEDHINIMPIEVIDNISELFANHNIVNDKWRNRFTNDIDIYVESLRNARGKTNNNYLKMACLAEDVKLLKDSTTCFDITPSGKDIFTQYQNLYEYSYILSTIKDIYNNTMLHESGILLEMDWQNTLKLAADRLGKAIKNLGDAEKKASKDIDVSMSSFRNAVERSMTNDNREAVIRGSILPSASKCLKLALAAGATAILINPVIAIIGVLGYLGTSKKFKAKERQMIIDEIEIELQMVDRYMKIAEDKDDLQAQRSLLTTRRQLERQLQRIKYKMKVDFGQDDVVKDTNPNNDND